MNDGNDYRVRTQWEHAQSMAHQAYKDQLDFQIVHGGRGHEEVRIRRRESQFVWNAWTAVMLVAAVSPKKVRFYEHAHRLWRKKGQAPTWAVSVVQGDHAVLNGPGACRGRSLVSIEELERDWEPVI